MSNVKVTTPCGWVFDLTEKTIEWPAENLGPATWPEVSQASQVYFGANYLASQAAARTVSDGFKKAWVEAGSDRKAKDAPKECVPKADSPEYVAALREARLALFHKLVEGYEVGERASAVDPFEEELDKLARPWLQAFATARGMYTLPAGKRRKADDADAYGVKYATFGEALAAFKAATTDSTVFAMQGGDGKPWPLKTRKGVSIADLLAAEARRLVEARGTPKTTVTGESGVAAEDLF